MSSPKKGAPVHQTREWNRAEYETKTRGLHFTKDFYTRQEALMRDPLATVGERFMAWTLRRSWGEYSLYAIREDGEPAYQRDCVRELGLDKTSVSHAVSYYQRRGYLEDRPKLLYPVISPVLVAPNPKEPKVAEYATFLADWKVAHSAENLKWEDARSTIKFFRKLVRSEYKKSREQKRKAAASLLETARSLPRPDQRADISPLEESNRRHQRTPAQTPVDEGAVITAKEAETLLFKQIATMQKAYPDSPFAKPPIDTNNAGDVGLVNRILQELGSRPNGRYDEQHLIGYIIHITAQFKGWGLGGSRKATRAPNDPTGPKGLGLLVNWAQDYARIAGRGGYGKGTQA